MSHILLETRNLSKHYRLGSDILIKALDGVSMRIHQGEFASITGKSGSGKSTLMHIIGLLDSPTSGEIFLNGKNITSLNTKQLAHIRNKSIGFVFQSFNLLPKLTALENVMLPLMYSGVKKSLWKEKALEMLDKVELSDRINNKPNEMSGGQKQRVAIARALVNDPNLILADEPTGNLDSKTTQDIIELFTQLHEHGTTVIIVTHDPDIAHLTKRKIELMDGNII
jgi:putative ABC transport system ATP-binding protein